LGSRHGNARRRKKAGAIEYTNVSNRTGLQADWPPGDAELPFMSSTDSDADWSAYAPCCIHYYADGGKCNPDLPLYREFSFIRSFWCEASAHFKVRQTLPGHAE